MNTYPAPAGSYHALRCAGPGLCSCAPIIVTRSRGRASQPSPLVRLVYNSLWPDTEAVAGADGYAVIYGAEESA